MVFSFYRIARFWDLFFWGGRSNKMLLELSMTLGTLLGKYFFLRDSANNPEGVIRDSRVSVCVWFFTVSRDYLPCNF